MTEAEWRNGGSPEAMLNYLGPGACPRKLRLYAVACCRRVWHLLRDEHSRGAVEAAERYAEGLDDAVRLAAAGEAAGGGHGAARAATQPSAWVAAWDAAWEARLAARDGVPGTDWEKERAHQAGLLRELFVNPFAPPRVEPAWLWANDGAAARLARALRDEQRFDAMPILADALEEAGCASPDLLGHCRVRGPHCRGCWALDALLEALPNP
jgi:hypothetical protein